MRLVLDTNVAAAVLLWAGPPRRLLDRAIDDDTLTLYSTPTLVDELTRALLGSHHGIAILTAQDALAVLSSGR